MKGKKSQPGGEGRVCLGARVEMKGKRREREDSTGGTTREAGGDRRKAKDRGGG